MRENIVETWDNTQKIAHNAHFNKNSVIFYFVFQRQSFFFFHSSCLLPSSEWCINVHQRNSSLSSRIIPLSVIFHVYTIFSRLVVFFFHWMHLPNETKNATCNNFHFHLDEIFNIINNSSSVLQLKYIVHCCLKWLRFERCIASQLSQKHTNRDGYFHENSIQSQS